MKMSYLIKVDDLSVSFNSQIILSNISMTLKEKEIITIIGPNGAGKSTLIKAILGLIKYDQGVITIKKGIRIGYMPQKIVFQHLMPITVKRFLMLTPYKISNRALNKLLVELSIDHIMSFPLQNISGGELQRILLARALLNDPDLLILDEPTQGVDITGQADFYQLINLVKEKYNCGILVVSHDLHLVMANSNSVLCLNKHICCFGHPDSVRNHPSFLKIFGEKLSKDIAVYKHNHDHKHLLNGKIIDDN